MMKLNRIFVRMPNWLGDAVMATAFVRMLRRTYPKAFIALGGRPKVEDLFENNPDINAFIPIEDHGLGLLSGAMRLRKHKFDVGFVLPNSFRVALQMRLAGIPKRVGYGRDGRNFLLTDLVEATPEVLELHMVDYYAHLLDTFTNLEAQPRELVLEPGTEAIAEAEAIIRSEKLDSRMIVGLCPGAAFGTAKRWLPENFARVAEYVAEKYDAVPVITGAPNEQDVMHEVARLAQCETVVLDQGHSLQTIIALMGQFALFVTNDCGAMHLAAARGVPIVAIFGPTIHENTSPYTPYARLLRAKGVDCEDNPCMRRHCPNSHLCMKSVTPEMAFGAIDALLNADTHTTEISIETNGTETK